MLIFNLCHKLRVKRRFANIFSTKRNNAFCVSYSREEEGPFFAIDSYAGEEDTTFCD